MPFHQPDSVRYLTFELFEGLPITHAAFTRIGGVSSGQWSQLNVGLTVGDDPELVAENRLRSFQAVGRDIETLSDSWLVHETAVLVYDKPRPKEWPYPPQADIILTDNPEVTLFMRYADCTPLLLYDPVQHALGLAHSGWKGTVKKVGQAVVAAMKERYSSQPENILAVVGPAIGPEMYEVGAEVIEAVQEAFGEDAPDLLPQFGLSTHFDLWAANRLILEQAGVRNIQVAEICTRTHNQDWFSHRADKGKTGRFGVLMGLNEH